MKTKQIVAFATIVVVAALVADHLRNHSANQDLSTPKTEAELLEAFGASSSSEAPMESIAPAGWDSSFSESSIAEEPWKEITLVDQDYSGVSQLKGAEWLRAIKTKLIRGNISEGELVITLARGENVKSWSAAGVYLAKAATSPNGHSYPDNSAYGNHLHFLDATWVGDCRRHLAPDSSFGVLKAHDAELRMPLDALRFAKGDDGCIAGEQEVINVIPDIASGGLYLGFQPSDKPVAPYMKVVLRYRGELDVTPF